MEFLRAFKREFDRALVIFDHEGSGASKGPEDLEDKMEEGLERSGWQRDRTCVVAIYPELEIWAWNGSNETASCIKWPSYARMKQAIQSRCEELWPQGHPKPLRPKEAFELALRLKSIPLSASIYREIAGSTGLSRCEDRAFVKLIEFLRRSFPSG